VRQATFNQGEIPNGPILLRERQVNSVRIDAPRDARKMKIHHRHQRVSLSPSFRSEIATKLSACTALRPILSAASAHRD
jgi:hypothetical protein